MADDEKVTWVSMDTSEETADAAGAMFQAAMDAGQAAGKGDPMSAAVMCSGMMAQYFQMEAKVPALVFLTLLDETMRMMGMITEDESITPMRVPKGEN